MADKRTQRRQQKQAKQKKNREAAQLQRKGRSTKGVGGLDAAGQWPLGECYAGSNWHEKGARLYAAVTRVHASGRTAVGVFEVDLAERGVVSAKTAVVDREEHAIGYVAQQTEGGDPVLESTPALVAKLVNTAAAHGRAQGHKQPGNLSEATALFAGVDPSQCEQPILVGAPLGPKQKKTTLFSWLFGRYWD